MLLSLSLSSAFATYNANCMRLLRPPRPAAIENYFQYMKMSVYNEPFTSDLDPDHLEPIDYETIFDLTHNMPMIAVFSDGSRANLHLNRQSMVILHDKLKTLNVVNVLYLPEALNRIRFVLKQACIHMNFPSCDS
jgi:hypothetical protein